VCGFMCGVAAIGKSGGDHTMTMLKRQLKQVMERVKCQRVEDLPKHLVFCGEYMLRHE
jgi:L-lactate dehydrogenase (cytochrome)